MTKEVGGGDSDSSVAITKEVGGTDSDSREACGVDSRTDAELYRSKFMVREKKLKSP